MHRRTAQLVIFLLASTFLLTADADARRGRRPKPPTVHQQKEVGRILSGGRSSTGADSKEALRQWFIKKTGKAPTEAELQAMLLWIKESQRREEEAQRAQHALDISKGRRFLELAPGLRFKLADDAKWDDYLGQKAHEQLSVLRNMKFDSADAVIISLTRNSETVRKIRKSQLLGRRAREMEERSKEGLLKLIGELRNSTVFLIGHVEGTSFVIEREGEPIEVPIYSIYLNARRNNVLLVALGCEAGNQADVGAATTFNSLLALRQVEAALGASNYAEMLERMAIPQLALSITPFLYFGMRLDPFSFDVAILDRQAGDRVGTIFFTRGLSVDDDNDEEKN